MAKNIHTINELLVNKDAIKEKNILSLINLSEGGFNIPKFLYISPEVHEKLISSISQKIKTDIEEIKNLNKISQASKIDQLRKLVLDTPLNPTIVNEITDFIFKYFPYNSKFLVKSHKTYDCENDVNKILEAIKDTYASNLNIRVGIIIVEKVFGEVTGITHTINSMNSDTSELLIHSNFAQNNQDTPIDSFIINKQGISLVKSDITNESSTLNENQLHKLSEYFIKIENHFGIPQEIEWVLKSDIPYILKSKPISSFNEAQYIEESKIEKDFIETNLFNETTSKFEFSILQKLTHLYIKKLFSLFSLSNYFTELNIYRLDNLISNQKNLPNLKLSNLQPLINLLPQSPKLTKLFYKLLFVKDSGFSMENKSLNYVKTYVFYVMLFVNFLILPLKIMFFKTLINSQKMKLKNINLESLSLRNILENIIETESSSPFNSKIPILNDIFLIIAHTLYLKLFKIINQNNKEIYKNFVLLKWNFGTLINKSISELKQIFKEETQILKKELTDQIFFHFFPRHFIFKVIYRYILKRLEFHEYYKNMNINFINAINNRFSIIADKFIKLDYIKDKSEIDGKTREEVLRQIENKI